MRIEYKRTDFKWCVNCGGKVQFEWHGKVFGLWPNLRKTSDAPLQMLISQVLIENMEATAKWCNNADEVPEYIIDGERLRDIITQADVTGRTIFNNFNWLVQQILRHRNRWHLK